MTISVLLMVSVILIMGFQTSRALIIEKQFLRIQSGGNWVKETFNSLKTVHIIQCYAGLLDISELVNLGFISLPPEWLHNPTIQLDRKNRRVTVSIEATIASPSDRARLARQTVSGAQITVTGSGVRWVKQLNGQDHMGVRINRDVEMFGAPSGCP